MWTIPGNAYDIRLLDLPYFNITHEIMKTTFMALRFVNQFHYEERKQNCQ